jgi:hypothetical protein
MYNIQAYTMMCTHITMDLQCTNIYVYTSLCIFVHCKSIVICVHIIVYVCTFIVISVHSIVHVCTLLQWMYSVQTYTMVCMHITMDLQCTHIHNDVYTYHTGFTMYTYTQWCVHISQ